MILFRKSHPLRIRRYDSPEPPFFCATAISPYGSRHETPLAVDYLALQVTGAERLEVSVCENVVTQLEAAKQFAFPVVIEAAGSAEAVFQRGREAAEWCRANETAAALLVSSASAVPDSLSHDDVLMVVAWPSADSTALLEQAGAQSAPWGVVVPIVFPLSTDADALSSLAKLAASHGASFFAPLSLALDPAARQSVAQSLDLRGDDDHYAMLFHGQSEPLQTAAERHAAAAAAANGLADFSLPPRWEARSNWNAAVLLTLTASRMLAMELDLDLAAALARAARTIAALDKPLERIARTASLGIIEGLDETSQEIVGEWLEGRSPGFVEYVNEQWRL